MTVLALLLSLLLGYAPAAASGAEFDRSAARLGKSEAGKAGAVLRTGGRIQSDDDLEQDELLVGSAASPVTASLWQRPAQAPLAGVAAGSGAPLTRAYRARAPPAA